MALDTITEVEDFQQHDKREFHEWLIQVSNCFLGLKLL